jgi:hypothetical protein
VEVLVDELVELDELSEDDELDPVSLDVVVDELVVEPDELPERLSVL